MNKDKEYKKTIKYYNSIAKDYVKSTAAVVLEEQISQFISKITSWWNVLDMACWPWHDTIRFSEEWFNCLWIDASVEMIKIAKELAKHIQSIEFKVQNIMDFNDYNKFDWIWCSSIFVHLDKTDVPFIIKKLKNALKDWWTLWILTAKEQSYIKRKKWDYRKYTMYQSDELKNFLEKQWLKIVSSDVVEYWWRDRIFIISEK